MAVLAKPEPVAELDVKVNVERLNALDAFMDKHGDKLQLVGSFELKKGDTLFLKTDSCFSEDAIDKIKKLVASVIPGLKVVILEEGMELVGVGKKPVPSTE